MTDPLRVFTVYNWVEDEGGSIEVHGLLQDIKKLCNR